MNTTANTYPDAPASIDAATVVQIACTPGDSGWVAYVGPGYEQPITEGDLPSPTEEQDTEEWLAQAVDAIEAATTLTLSTPEADGPDAWACDAEVVALIAPRA